ncbi:MAG: RnfABCDGE type electron transport complex subunit D [Halothermotrichaceae bacterium]
MMREQLVVSSSPHVRDNTTVNQIMWSVVLALLPAVIAAIYIFKMQAFFIILVTVLGSVLTEYVFQKIRGKSVTIGDGSAVITGILLALTLPPTVPLWMALLGSIVAIGLGKQVFGGLGYNPFNPALVGRAFLLVAYSGPMTKWTEYLNTGIDPSTGMDVMTSSTPLALMQSEEVLTPYWQLFMGNIGGSLGETSAFVLLLGAAYLIYKGYLNWRIPVSMVGTVFVLSFILGKDPVFAVLAGGLILGAFYMATDMVTSPITKKGRWLFGLGAGIIVVVIRLGQSYPEGVLFSILLMNTTVPLLNRFTRPRSFGEVKK